MNSTTLTYNDIKHIEIYGKTKDGFVPTEWKRWHDNRKKIIKLLKENGWHYHDSGEYLCITNYKFYCYEICKQKAYN